MRKLAALLLLIVGSAAVALAESENVPEINAASGASALALISGGLLILRSRRKK